MACSAACRPSPHTAGKHSSVAALTVSLENIQAEFELSDQVVDLGLSRATE